MRRLLPALRLSAVLMIATMSILSARGIEYPGSRPGPAEVLVRGEHFVLQNQVLSASWKITDTGPGQLLVFNTPTGSSLSLGTDVFQIVLSDETVYRSSELMLLSKPVVRPLPPQPESSRLAGRTAGQVVELLLGSSDSRLRITWRVLLLDDTNYVRQEIELGATNSDVTIREISWCNMPIVDAVRVGSVDGSLVVAEPFFFGCEDPMAENRVLLPEKEFGSWSPTDFKTGRQQKKIWPLALDSLTQESLVLEFRYERGPHRLDIFQVSLFEDGLEIARDEHHGYTGITHVDNTFRLRTPSIKSDAKYEIVAQLNTDPNFKLPAGGTVQSWGKVWLQGEGGTVRCQLQRNAELRRLEILTQSFVMGVYPKDQLRRAFLYYLEHERAHPYRPFLHYNSWYDIAWTPFALNEQNCIEAIQLFGERFIKRHDVVMDALVFDDGWDDPKTLWHFHSGFPDGFAPLAKLCRQYNTRLGVWLSPFGGYGEPKKQRLENGHEKGYEVNDTGFSLAGPKYYEVFKQACVEMIQKYGVNHFKFDGIAQGMHAAGSGEYVRDVEAMRRLMLELRQEDPNLYINLTTGSWPSPFWLRYADSVWRQGGDMGFSGVGTKQQQWLTYRDQETYRNIVRRGPLYPLNSLMTQGVAYSRHGYAGDPTFTSDGFKDDVRAFFGSGTGLQELYIQPGKLTDQDWSVLAEAAKWSRANADVLVDTHWIGGDPGKLEVYGFASWSSRKGVIVIRNPDERPQEFMLDLSTAFELPLGAPTTYRLHSPWQEDTDKPAFIVEADKPLRILLQPFQVSVWDANAVK